MSTPPNFLDLPWRWQISAGSLKLVVDNGDGFILLRAPPGGALLTRADDGGYRNLDASDELAKIIAFAPEVRRHARALIHGIDLKLVHVASTKHAMAGGRRSAIDHDKDLNLVLTGLREALEKSGAV